MKTKMKTKTKKAPRLISLDELIKSTFPIEADRLAYLAEYEKHREAKRKKVLADFGKKLKAARVSSGLTQNMLAKELNTDIANISRIEHGRHNLTVDYIVKVGHALKRPVSIEI